MARIRQRWDNVQESVRAWPFGTCLAVLIAATALGAPIIYFISEATQDKKFHNFAPSKLNEIDNFWIVASNGGFLLVGLLGLWLLWKQGLAQRLFPEPGRRWPVAAFFLSVVFLAFASSYYHLFTCANHPEGFCTGPLAWDRLGMTLVFMAFFALVMTDRIEGAARVKVLLPGLLLVGALSIVTWVVSDDLRFYRVVEILPIPLIVLICLLFEGRVTRFKYVLWMGLWFGLATLLEHFDWQVYGSISIGGHVLKHLAAAVACYMVVAMLRDAERWA